MPTHDMTSMADISCAGCKQSYAESALFCPNCGRPKVREAVQDALVGKVLGERFQVLDQIGQGGSGTIYRAEHVTLRRKVAIKVLHTELSRDDLAVERFRREATTVAEIDNEHIVEIHDFGRTPDGRLYLAMELLEGETLDNVLAREKTLSVERVADILIQVGEALMEAHAIGYIHRDLRPRNVYLAVRRGKANFVKLFDFGLAKLVETDASAASTSLGMTFGDPRYMSPEQARGDRIDRRADIYQLGCVAYEMLTGAPPFTGNRVFDILTKQVTEIPTPLPSKRPGVPIWMEAAVAKMLAKDPENRFATTTRMVEALRRGLETGEVMEDEIARRRESIPPPSVSRVMQRFGMTSQTDTPREMPPKAEIPATPEPAPAPSVTAKQAPPLGKQTKRYDGPLPAVPEAMPAAQPGLKQTMRYDGPLPTAAAPKPAAPQPAPTPRAALPDMPVRSGPPEMPAPLTAPVAKAESDAEIRRRTGTPRVGVPVVTVDTPSTQAPVTGLIDPPSAPIPAKRGSSQAEPSGRAKRPSSSHGSQDSGGISQVWYADGDRESEEAETSRKDRARKVISPSATDMSLYDEPASRGKRWPLLLVGAGALAILGVAVAFAVTRKSAPSETPPPPHPVALSTGPSIDAAPSQEIGADPADAPVAAVTPPVHAEPVTPPVIAKKDPHPPVHVDPPAHTTTHATVPDPEDLARRRPGGNTNPTNTNTNTHTTVVVTPPNPGKGSGSGKTGVSGADGPVDPYGAEPAGDPSTDAAPEKKAEFYANLGQQQLISGDAAGAASSFKKASELDPKNSTAVIGMGEIAMRQGLFGDAIAHLKRGAKMSPRSSRVFTLLGEAYLNSGQNSVAAENFKKALQLDPDNARAREGYNEASSRVPPADDDH
ncbi:MAG: serine/threonine protein kinase with repeat [Myxococcales bacterium]|nr:serine/threonine protein kinase with repeat [Myxococcales bacterium]